MKPSDSSAPLLHVAQGVATITLNRSAQRNRLENTDLSVLLQHFEQINLDKSVRVVVLTANTQGHPKPVFCAGYDIGGFSDTDHGSTAFEKVPQALNQLRVERQHLWRRHRLGAGLRFVVGARRHRVAHACRRLRLALLPQRFATLCQPLWHCRCEAGLSHRKGFFIGRFTSLGLV